ncbi:hypothetical protein XENTR_v10004402 [Xenopus tropicalis]|nr:hypothetical protein XENTR_v10004402 [Xenopus tropicalis]
MYHCLTHTFCCRVIKQQQGCKETINWALLYDETTEGGYTLNTRDAYPDLGYYTKNIV